MSRPRDPRIERLTREGRLPPSPLLASPVAPASPCEQPSSSTSTTQYSEINQIICSLIDPQTMACKKPEDPNLAYAFYQCFKDISPQNFTNEQHRNIVTTLKCVFYNHDQKCQQLVKENEEIKEDFVAKEYVTALNKVFSDDDHKREIEGYKNEIDSLKLQLQKEREGAQSYYDWFNNIQSTYQLQQEKTKLEEEKKELQERFNEYRTIFCEMKQTVKKLGNLDAKDKVEIARKRKRPSNNGGSDDDTAAADDDDDGNETTSKRKK